MKQIVKEAIKKSFGAAGLELRRKSEPVNQFEMEPGSLLVPKIWRQPFFQELVASQLDAPGREVILLGDDEQINYLRAAFEKRNSKSHGVRWDWQADVDLSNFPSDSPIVVCRLPQTEEHWRIMKRLRERFGNRVIGIQELVLPLTTIMEGLSSLTYSVNTMEELTSYYTGQAFFGPLQELNAAFPLSGKRIIEFGPMEGSQTAGLVKLGAESVTCIEARAVSFIKTMIAQYCLGWRNVRLLMDDFHNADRNKYGEFDLAFAHGVYYHSLAPFLFFENLMSLSRNIFIGGYTLLNHAGSNDTLSYDGQTYRVKKITIGNTFNNAANEYAYHLDRDDLISFFADRNYDVTVISDESPNDPWGDWFLRFIARKRD